GRRACNRSGKTGTRWRPEAAILVATSVARGAILFAGGRMPMDTVAVENRFTEVRQRVADAAKRAGRRPEDVLLVAVTKYAEPDQIRELLHLGHRDLGENHVQQLLQRAAMLDEYMERRRILSRTPGAEGEEGVPPRWHLIGRRQSNNAKNA